MLFVRIQWQYQSLRMRNSNSAAPLFLCLIVKLNVLFFKGCARHVSGILFMKKLKFLLLLAIGLSLSACDNDKGDSNPPDDPLEDKTLVETPIIKQNKELYFTESDGKQIEVDTVKKYLAMDNIDTVFLVPVGTFFAPDYYDHPGYFKMARDALLQELIDLSPRVRGKGDFITNLGYPLQYGEDSLWMVENGWTVNKYWIDQLNQNTK